MRKTWTRNDIIEAISDNVGLSLSESSEIIEEIFKFILCGYFYFFKRFKILL